MLIVDTTHCSLLHHEYLFIVVVVLSFCNESWPTAASLAVDVG